MNVYINFEHRFLKWNFNSNKHVQAEFDSHRYLFVVGNWNRNWRKLNLSNGILVIFAIGDDCVFGAEYVVEGSALRHAQQLQRVLHRHLERRGVIGARARLDRRHRPDAYPRRRGAPRLGRRDWFSQRRLNRWSGKHRTGRETVGPDGESGCCHDDVITNYFFLELEKEKIKEYEAWNEVFQILTFNGNSNSHIFVLFHSPCLTTVDLMQNLKNHHHLMFIFLLRHINIHSHYWNTSIWRMNTDYVFR